MRSLPAGCRLIQPAEMMPKTMATTAHASASANPYCSSMNPLPQVNAGEAHRTGGLWHREAGPANAAGAAGGGPAASGGVQPGCASLSTPPEPGPGMKPGCIALCIAGWLGAQAPLAAQAPEIVRPAAAPQPTGAVHTLRQIPEACARIEGVFTGDADGPYRFSVVQTSPACQPRARLVDAAKARPSEADGWIFHDLIRVPN